MVDAISEIDKAGETALDAVDKLAATAAVAQWTETEISRVDGVLTIHASEILRVQAGLAGKADVSVTQALQATIIEHDGRLDTQGLAITLIQNTLPGKADVSVTEALQTAITEQGGLITAQATRTDDLFVALGGDVNRLRVKYEVMSGPSGYSRFGIVGSTSAGQDRAASGFMDVPNNASLPTRWLFDADQFIIRTSGAEESPFVFEGGVLTMKATRVQDITAGTLRSPDNKFIFTVAAGRMEWFD